jgi:hypothetical protein
MTSDSGFESPFGYGRRADVAAPEAPAVTHHRPTRGLVVGLGVGIALALGLTVGLLARPELDIASEAPAKPMAPAAPGAQQGLTIQPGAPQVAATAVPRPAGKLQVLPPDMVARAAVVSARSAPMAVRDVSDVVADPEPTAEPKTADDDPR